MGKIKEWLKEGELNEQFLISDIAQHGCEGGVAGLIYYDDSVSFYNKHEEEIWEYLNEAADAAGETIGSLLPKNVVTPTSFKNWCAWFAVESAAQDLADGQQQE